MRIINNISNLDINTANDLNNMAKQENILLIFSNTKRLKPNIIDMLSHNITISITGGLNPKKQKFNNNHYQERTYYKPNELSHIITMYEKIERKINPIWTDLEKCMFVYQQLCHYSTYSECILNDNDAARNLLGMITGKSVCSGYAIIFKEAMDRIGIDCLYQNRQSHHSWNIVKIDGHYHGVELTWDTYNKKNNTCGFAYFCRSNQKEFYDNKHHDISNEAEEQKYPLEKIDESRLIAALNKINEKRVFISQTQINNRQEYIKLKGKTIIIRNGIPYLDNNIDNTYIRNDGTSFIIFPTGLIDKGVNEYIYVEYNVENKMIRATKIYSEMNLIETDTNKRDLIANNLMTKSRMKEKINDYNGYIGYISFSEKSRYYDRNFEENVIHKYR